MRTLLLYLSLFFLSIATVHAQSMKKMVQKTEFENLEIIGLIRGAKISTENLNDVITAYRSKSGVPFSSQKQEENKHEEN